MDTRKRRNTVYRGKEAGKKRTRQEEKCEGGTKVRISLRRNRKETRKIERR